MTKLSCGIVHIFFETPGIVKKNLLEFIKQMLFVSDSSC